MKRFIQLTYGSGDKVWVDVDSISAVSEYNMKSDPDMNAIINLKGEGVGWHIRETPKEVLEMISGVEE